MNYLEFEEPIKELDLQLLECNKLGEATDVDVSETRKKIELKLNKKIKEIYGKLTPWQKVQISRHPDRPYTLDYIKNITGNTFLELHGDRNFKDDKAMIGGLGRVDNQSFMFIGQQRGKILKIDNIAILEWQILKDIEKLLD